MLTVLMIDDDVDVTATIRDYFEENVPDVSFHSQIDFDQGLLDLRRIRPHVLILDVFHGNPATGDAAGEAIWTNVWNTWFCPLVVYTAGEADFETPVPDNHPFVTVVSKGPGTEQQIAAHAVAYRTHAEALHEVADNIERVTHSVLKNLAPQLFAADQNVDARRDTLVRAARRRVAAMMDEASGDQKLHSWEQYVFPVVTTHPLTGDILRLAEGDPKLPESFRVILTPTCDIAAKKVTNIVVGQCTNHTEFITKGIGLAANTGKGKIKERLPAALNEAHQSGFVLLPACPGLTPMMALNLRDVELLPLASVGQQYVRVATLDSPFREFLAWGFLQIGCRPGVPPRDNTSLIDAITAVWGQQA